MQKPTLTKSLRVLLVEDSPLDAALLQDSLSEAGVGSFTFTHAQTWREAASLARREVFDVMLLDLSLPDVTGADTFLRARAEVPDMPIVMLTGTEDEALGLSAVRHGIQDYLIKGQAYGRQTARAIRYAIERKQNEDALKRAESSLQQERDLLETYIRERTAALSEANRELQKEIQQRQRAEEAHRQVLRRLAESEENERRRFSRELHDRLGQDLTALKLGLQMTRKQAPLPEAVLASLAKLEGVVEGLMHDTHRLAWELRPSVLDDLGLELALRRFVAQWSENCRVPVDFHASGLGESRLNFEIETTVYRLTQEALTNVARHAHATRVSVLVESRAEMVSLIVEDDGQGFQPEAILTSPHHGNKLGLLGMQERVILVGGTLSIESKPGAGTSVFARLPLPVSNSQLPTQRDEKDTGSHRR